MLARTVRSKVNFAEDIDALRNKTQEAYEKLLADKQGALTELSTALCKRLADWAHPDALLKLEWRQDQDKSVRVEDPLAQIIAGESGFEGNLARFGHGLQRSYLLALEPQRECWQDDHKGHVSSQFSSDFNLLLMLF